MPMILQLMLMRLQENRSPQLIKLFIHFLCVVASSSHGASYIFNILESVQPGMCSMIIADIWAPQVDYLSQIESLELNQMVFGGLELLVNSPVTANPNTWVDLFKILLHLLNTNSATSAVGKNAIDLTHLFDDDSESREFDSTYSKLAYAQIIETVPSVLEGSSVEVRAAFALKVSQFCKSSPGKYSNILRNQLPNEEQAILQEIIVETGCEIV
jgi:hypothetical protein